MSKALKTVGMIAGAVALVATGVGAFAAAGTALAATAGSVASIATATALAANVGSQLTAKKPPIVGSSTSLTIGPDQPPMQMIGDTYCGGAIAHKTGYGAPINDVPNPYLAMPVIYSTGGPITAIDTYYADFQPLTFSGDEATGYFAEILFRRFSLGAMLQGTALTGPWGAIPGWGADANLSGKAHVLWSAKWDSKNGKYSSGLPQLGIRGRGVIAWDPRADDTWPGGMGPQRWANPSNKPSFDTAITTWTYTAGPGLQALRYALGSWERDLTNIDSEWTLTFGVGLGIDQVVVEDFVELQNICDANGWTVNGVILEPAGGGEKWANLKRILAAGGAEPCWKGGRLGVKVTAPRVSLDTIEMDDIADGDLRGQGGAAWRDRINAVIPRYTSPDHKWELQSAAKIIDADLVAEDGEEKPREVVTELCTNFTQASQLAVYEMLDSREFGPIELPVLPRLRRYRGGDRLTLSQGIIDAFGFPHGEVVVLDRTFDPGTMTGTLMLMGDTAAKHTTALATVGAPPGDIVLPATGDYDGAAGGGATGAQSFIVRVPAYPLTSDEDSITIAAFNGTLPDGTTASYAAGAITGLAESTKYGVFIVKATGAYFAEPYPSTTALASSANIWIYNQSTSDGTGTYPDDDAPPGGWGGGGGGGVIP